MTYIAQLFAVISLVSMLVTSDPNKRDTLFIVTMVWCAASLILLAL